MAVGDWAWDRKTKRYRNTKTGRFITNAKMTQLRDEFAERSKREIAALARRLAEKEITVQAWEKAMRAQMKAAIGAQWMFGRGGVNAMDASDWGKAGKDAKDASTFLRGFAKDVAAGKHTEKGIVNRAGMYFDSTIASYERGRAAAFGVTLPAYPADGGTQCKANCVTGDTLVSGLTPAQLVYRRWYEGPMVRLRTASRVLTVTPNHPILSERGWIAAREIEQGDKLIGAALDERARARSPYVDDLPTESVQSLYARAHDTRGLRVPGGAMDFHGDGSAGEVEIIALDRQLRDDVLAARFEPCPEHGFGGRGILREPELLRDRLSAARGDAHGTSTGSGVGVGGQRGALVATHSSQTVARGISSRAWDDAALDEYARDQGAATADLAGDSQDAFPGAVTRDEVIGVEVLTLYSGHVYNLQTDEGWYIANGTIIHNCKCRWEIKETATEVRATWRLNAAAENCDGCKGRASSYAPHTIQKEGA